MKTKGTEGNREVQSPRLAGVAGAPDTIVAIATPPGRGAIGVLRVSGPHTTQLAQRLLGRLPAPRHALLADFRDADGEDVPSVRRRSHRVIYASQILVGYARCSGATR